MVNCPKCDAVIDVDEDELDEGDSLLCEECGAELTVTGLSPLELMPDEDFGARKGVRDDLDEADEDDEDEDDSDFDDDELDDLGDEEEEEDDEDF
jgi:alpha-aminoadipate carrier protein LysW